MRKPDSIDDYLLKLGVALDHDFPKDPALVHRAVLEARDHLEQAATACRAAGLSPEEAEREAITAFGPPEKVARQFARELGGRLPASGLLVRSMLHAGAFAGSLFLALGVTGALLFAPGLFSLNRIMALPRPTQQEVGVAADDCADLALQAPSGQEQVSQEDCQRFVMEMSGGIQDAAERFFYQFFTVGSLVVLGVGLALVWAHRTLLRWHTRGAKDRSGPAQAHALLGVAIFGYVGLLVWPGAVMSLLPPGAEFDYNVAVGALVTLAFFLGYARSLRTLTT